MKNNGGGAVYTISIFYYTQKEGKRQVKNNEGFKLSSRERKGLKQSIINILVKYVHQDRGDIKKDGGDTICFQKSTENELYKIWSRNKNQQGVTNRFIRITDQNTLNVTIRIIEPNRSSTNSKTKRISSNYKQLTRKLKIDEISWLFTNNKRNWSSR